MRIQPMHNFNKEINSLDFTFNLSQKFSKLGDDTKFLITIAALFLLNINCAIK